MPRQQTRPFTKATLGTVRPHSTKPGRRRLAALSSRSAASFDNSFARTFLAQDVVTLLPHECTQLLELSAELSAASPGDEPEHFCMEAQRIARRLPDRLHDLIAVFALRGSHTGTMLFDRLPDDGEGTPATPPDNKAHVGEGTRLARVAAILSHAAGLQMVGYEAEGRGRLFQDMVPNRALALTQTSLGSGVELELHTEQCFSRIRPDILSLACLRGHPGARTFALPAHALLAHLTPAERAMLREPLWMTGVDGSFRMEGDHTFIDGDLRGPLAIISGAEDDPCVLFDQDLMSGITPEAHALIGRVVEAYKARRFAVELEPGQILLVDNVRALHGRSPFAPRFDGTDRFIVRSFAIRDMVRTRHARPAGTRTHAAEFS